MKLLLVSLCLSAFACGSGTHNGDPDAGPADAGCVINPRTSLEILNACTDAGFLDKHPSLPLLLPDGGLPPLP